MNYEVLRCSKCKEHPDETCPKKLIMITNVKFKGASRCADCLTIK